MAAKDSKIDSQINNKKPPPICGSIRLIVTILCFFTMVHIMSMRFNFSMAVVCMTGTNSSAHPDQNIEGEFDWDRSTVGLLLGAFFYGYVFTLMPGGFMADRIGVRTGLGFGLTSLALSSLVLPPLARIHYGFVVAIRILQGIISGVLMPMCYNAFTTWSSPSEKSTLMAMGYSGGTLAYIITHPISSLICYGMDWPFMFYLPAISCGLNALGFFALTTDEPDKHKRISDAERQHLMKYSCRNIGKGEKDKKGAGPVPWSDMFTSVPVHALWIVHLCQAAIYYFININIPLFINETFQLGMVYNGILCGLPFIPVMIMNLSGKLFDVIVNSKKMSATNLRKIVTGISLLVPSILFCFMNTDSAITRITLLIIATSISQMCLSAGFFTSHAELAGPYAGTLFGFTNTVAQTGGLVNPLIIAYLVPNGTRHEWQIVFYIMSIIGFCGTVVYSAFGSSERQNWADK